jgi:hypothetical protein
VWRAPDEGIWEVRGGREHFTYSKVMTWVAFDRSIKQGSDDYRQMPLRASLWAWAAMSDGGQTKCSRFAQRSRTTVPHRRPGKEIADRKRDRRRECAVVFGTRGSGRGRRGCLVETKPGSLLVGSNGDGRESQLSGVSLPRNHLERDDFGLDSLIS